ncbi:unnamed protein product [Periconia digitata]|uniref:Uncharacterized protein n=1 Tax=Periconia digitata TaxID=1303443 RepID=A0A9W4UJT5_9PLEO|nr:unnamed protein product [Periconia digitata]
MSDTAPTKESPNATEILEDAIKTQSTSQLDKALWEAVNNLDFEKSEEFAKEALRKVVRAGSSVLAAHLIESEGVPISALDELDIGHNPSIPLFETLAANGWDVNQASPKDNWRRGRRTIDRVIGDHELVVWLVEHGADVNHGEEEYDFEPRPPLLTVNCAASGSVETFKYLLSHGARIGRRTMHLAAGEAAAVGANPGGVHQTDSTTEQSNDKEDSKSALQRRREREEMLRYLVDELGLDVNAQDSDSDAAKRRHYGTPLNYAVQHKDGVAVVRWLLQKGADPTLKGISMAAEPRTIAESSGYMDIAEALADKS